ncbi:hypothetical protein LCGC14_1641290 [marine sediment metagenome]|uniref:Uncharacterized protein n=1 Tax=marine sediment metagenome TaxID=412755 RepID=A0A0F9I067_9ZZZZ
MARRERIRAMFEPSDVSKPIFLLVTSTLGSKDCNRGPPKVSGGFVKLYGDKLLDSSVWVGTPHNVKILWITMLSLADREGQVMKSLPGLARRADLTRTETVEALSFLMAPDPDSQTKLYEGRRVQELEKGWLLLNYVDHRDYRSDKQIVWAAQKREWRKKRAEEELQELGGHVQDVQRTSEEKDTEIEQSQSHIPSPKPHSARMDLVPTRDRPIVANTVLESLKLIGQIEIVEKELFKWQIRAGFAYWVAKMGKDNARVKLSLGRWDRLKKYIKMYNLETCLYAIDGARIHPDMNQDGRTFHEFEEIFMNKPEGPGRVEKLSEYARKKDKHPKHRLLEEHPKLEGQTC